MKVCVYVYICELCNDERIVSFGLFMGLTDE